LHRKFAFKVDREASLEESESRGD